MSAEDAGEVNRFREYFRGKHVLVTGGTGSFGHEIVSTLLTFEPARVVIFSRDEKKQWDMREEFRDNPVLDFVIGDVRDLPTLMQAVEGTQVVYHAAALKQIPTCEVNPIEATKTNVLGTEHVRQAAIEHRVETVVLISTDKAVKPVNAMGMTKALAEKIFLNQGNGKWNTRLVCLRYGNVVGSRGSVIPLFRERIAAGRPLPVTDPRMTRFLLTLPQAVELVLKATVEAKSGFVYVKKMPACRIGDLARAMSRAMTGRDDYPIDHCGVRSGEKMHEVLVSEEEMFRAEETESHFLISPVDQSRVPRAGFAVGEYASNTGRPLDEDGILELLRSAGWV